MKNLLVLLAFILFTYSVVAQIKNGRVIDSKTNEGIIGVNVKLLEYTQKTVTNEKGEFSVEGEGKIQIPFEGYEIIDIEVVVIHLKSKVYEL